MSKQHLIDQFEKDYTKKYVKLLLMKKDFIGELLIAKSNRKPTKILIENIEMVSYQIEQLSIERTLFILAMMDDNNSITNSNNLPN